MQVAQLDMFAAPPPVAEFRPDPLAERIIASGLVRNEYLLTVIGAAFKTKPFSDLPSRLFMHPASFVPADENNESWIALNHPDFASYAFVDEIEFRTGFRPIWKPLDDYGRDRGENWRYFHAVDLIGDDHWRDLIATRNFTDNHAIEMALCYVADYGGMSNDNMRAVLAEIGSAEPDDKSEALLLSDAVSITNCQQGEFVGFHRRDHHAVWAAIHGLETKRFKRDRNGHLRFAPDFLAQKQAEAIGDVT